MKKIFLATLAAGALLATSSCSMDVEPQGVIMEQDALTNVSDCAMFRAGFYANLRALTAGAYIYLTEIQMDQFVGDTGNGNQMGPVNNGEILASDGDIESIFGGIYGAIGTCNFYLIREAQMRELNELSEEDLQVLDRYKAECVFTRAYYYWYLLDHFCPVYNDVNKDRKLGLQLTTDYDPTDHKANYPGRSTLDETYKFIEDELDAAYMGLKAWEESDNALASEAVVPMAPYLSSYAVRALQARLALMKGDWAKARDYAQEVINCGLFPVVTRKAYRDMWTNDEGSEIIFRPYTTASEGGVASTGYAWINPSEYIAWYLPCSDLVNVGQANSVYVGKEDIRYVNNIGTRELAIEGSLVKAPVFTKFPGNPALQLTDKPNLLNMPKPFRTSELVLIVAEACYNLGEEGTANTMLTDLRKKRITGYTAQTYTGEELFNQIKLERLRELVGEGFRMTDLRRWGEGFTRNTSSYPDYPGVENILTIAGRQVVYQKNDYRYTWPIPSAEIQVNPQMEGQQNPGYPGSSY